jgi:SAM-dependent methyltransferase
MRSLPWSGAFDAVVNLFTSFGFFERERDNAGVIREVAQSLVPGGRFLIDLSHRDWLVRNFQPREWFRRGDLWVWEERRFDPVAGRLYVEHHWKSGDRQGQRHFDLRIYAASEVASMMRQSGLEVQACFGDYDGSPFGKESKRLLMVAQKP